MRGKTMETRYIAQKMTRNGTLILILKYKKKIRDMPIIIDVIRDNIIESKKVNTIEIESRTPEIIK